MPDLRNGYVDVCRTIVSEGRRVAPRGEPTYALDDVILEVADPFDVLPTGVGRKLVTAIGIAEAVQLIGSVSNPTMMEKIAPRMRQFMDPDGTFHGAYGRRIGNQVFDVVRKLTEDPDTRQAVIALWDPSLDNLPGHPDYPCTLTLTFYIREGALVLSTTMRSNDAWWGLAYDAVQFTQLQITVARALDVAVGPYHHHAINLHVYERDLEGVEALQPCDDLELAPRYTGIGRDGMPVSIIVDRARKIATGNGGRIEDPTETELAFMNKIYRP